MFEFKINLNDDDFLEFNKYHAFNNAVGKRNLTTFRVIIPFFCLNSIFILFVSELDFLLILIEAILMAIISILWVVFSKKMLIISMKSDIKKLKKIGKLPYAKESILTFDDKSMNDIAPDSSSSKNYSMIEKIAVEENAIYLYLNTMQACILPISAFSDEKEKQEFLKFIYSKTNIVSSAK